MFLNNIKNYKKIISNNIKLDDEVVIIKLDNDSIFFSIYWNKEKKDWYIPNEYDYDKINFIEKNKLDDLVLNMDNGLKNYLYIQNLKFLFLYKNKKIYLLTCTEGKDFFNNVRVDSEFYSILINTPVINYVCKFNFDYNKLMVFDYDILVQKFRNE